MTEQMFVTAILAMMFGVAVFVMLILIRDKKVTTIRRRKTTLGMVKIAGTDLKLEESEEAYGARPADESAAVADDAGENHTIREPATDDDIGEYPSAVKPADNLGGYKADDGKSAYDDDVIEDQPAVKSGAAGNLSGYKADDGKSAYDDDVIDDQPAVKPAAAVYASADQVIDELDIDDDLGDDQALDEPAVDNEAGKGQPLMESAAAGLNTHRAADESLPDVPPPSATQIIKRKRLPKTVRMQERRVLLAEDVRVNRELIAMFFEDSGVKFDFASDGAEACELFAKNPECYCLILMDIQMPVMDGYDAARKIRAHDSDWAKQIPIIAMTANIYKEEIDACFDAGMDDHVAKPLDMNDLQEKVFEFITQNLE